MTHPPPGLTLRAGRDKVSASPTAKEMNKLLRWLGEGPESGASNFDELCRAVSVRKNKEHALRFADVPFARRIVLVPQ